LVVVCYVLVGKEIPDKNQASALEMGNNP